MRPFWSRPARVRWQSCAQIDLPPATQRGSEQIANRMPRMSYGGINRALDQAAEARREHCGAGAVVDMPAASPMARDCAAKPTSRECRARSKTSPSLRRPPCSSCCGRPASSARNSACAYAEPMTFLSLRMIAVVLLLGRVSSLTRPKWPDRAGLIHSAVDRPHGARPLSRRRVRLDRERPVRRPDRAGGQPAAGADLDASPTAGSASACVPRQWLGLLLGLVGVYLIVHEKIAIRRDARRWRGWRPSWRCSASPSARSIRSGSAAASTGGPACCVQYAAAGRLVRARRHSSSRPRRCNGRRNSCSRSAGSSSCCRSARSGCCIS